MTLPTCFGKQWDSEAAECAGGRDENYYNPKTNSRVRARCEFFTSCGARVEAEKHQELIPVQNLARPPFRATPQPSFRSPLSSPPVSTPPMGQPLQYPQAPSQATQQLQAQVQQLTQQLQQASNELSARRTSAYQQYYPVQHAAYIPPPQAMPPYLAVPEPRTRGTSTMGRLGREMLRASMKAAGHQLASFWDVNPLSRSDDDGSG
jgi:hypothetical protein